MALRTPGQRARRDQLERVLRLAAPALDLVLGVGERISRVAGRNQVDPEPSRRSVRAEVRRPLGRGPGQP